MKNKLFLALVATAGLALASSNLAFADDTSTTGTDSTAPTDTGASTGADPMPTSTDSGDSGQK